MDYWIRADRVFDGVRLHQGTLLGIEDGCVAKIRSDVSSVESHIPNIAGLVSPGFIDLQVNGGGGTMLNTTPTRAGLQAITDAHRRFGTVAILPTVITDHPDVLDKAADAILAAFGDLGILGLHIEGPHISLARRGTHSAEFIRPMDQRTLGVVAGLRAAGVPVLITVAPEATTTDQVTQLAKMGAVVSLGHTDATSEEINSAIGAGANCATHLFNAMSPMTGRAAGAVGAIINSELYSGIISDGYHVADEMIGLAIRARPIRDRMFLVSDAMATVGGGESFQLYGQTISLKNGKLVNAEGSLAGAHVTQVESVKRLVEKSGIAIIDALKMATSNPAACLGLDQFGTLLGRSIEDVILLSDDLYYQGDLASNCVGV